MTDDKNPPMWNQRSTDGQHVAGTLFAAADLPVFAGHFPGNPLLPGIMQIDWAITVTAEAFADLPATAFSGMSRIKFKLPVRPGSLLELEVTRTDDVVTFIYQNEGSVCTEGRLHYKAAQ